LFKNKYGFIAYEFFQNSCSAPKKRSLLQVIIVADIKDNKEEFIKNCQQISRDFVQYHIQAIEKDIEEQTKQSKIPKEENKEEDVESSPQQEEIPSPPVIIAKLEFLQKIRSNNNFKGCYSNYEEGRILITHNDHEEMDIDFYYEEAARIIEATKFSQFTPIEETPNPYGLDEDEDTNQDKLIDDLFDSINI
jgi:hypothetical protein